MKKMIIILCSLASCHCATVNKDPSLYLENAGQYISQKNYPAALESATIAVNLAPKAYQGYYLQAQAYQKMNNTIQALSCYKQALAFEKKDPVLRSDYAELLCASANYADANQQYEEALQGAIANHISATRIRVSYGDCLTLQNNLDKASTNYLMALKDESAPLSAYLGISHAYFLENNPAMAYYYISLYKVTDNSQVLSMKILSLQQLLKTNSKLTDENRDNLQKKLDSYRVALAGYAKESQPLERNRTLPVIPIIKPVKIVDTSLAINQQKTSAKASPPASITNGESEILAFSSRIKTSTSGRKYIIVATGDTLFNISRRSSITINTLKGLNGMANNSVKIGQQFYLD